MLPLAALIELEVGDGFRVGGIELRGLIQIEGVLTGGAGGAVARVAAEIELCLGRPPGGMEQWRPGGLTDVAEDPAYGLGVGENRSEAELAEGMQ